MLFVVSLVSFLSVFRLISCDKQPSKNVNYTDTGYLKKRVSKDLFDILKTFWDENMENSSLEFFFNMVMSSSTIGKPRTHLVDINNSSNIGRCSLLYRKIADYACETVEELTHQKLLIDFCLWNTNLF